MSKHNLIHTRIIASATVGTILEWAEFTFFAYMAEQLSRLFFPSDAADWARFKTYAIFSVSYLMRPFGAVLFGHLGDRFGRKPALMYSMLLMAVATTFMGMLPTYAQIGIAAPLLLMLCRLLQGLAVSGEFHGAAVFIFEHTGHERPYLAGMWPAFAASAGMMLGGLASTLTALPNAPAWAWRLPFLCSGLSCLVAFYVRRFLSETPDFQKAQAEKKLSALPLWEACRQNPKGMLCTAAYGMFMGVFAYIGNVYYKTLLVKNGLSTYDAARIITLGQSLAAVLTLVLGYYADRIGGKRLCLLGLIATACLGPYIFHCANLGDLQSALHGQLCYALVNAFISAPMLGLILQQFSTQSRYSGSAFAWSISSALFASTALLIAEKLTVQLQWPQGPGYYISVIASLAAFIVFFSSQELKTSK
jgi:MHS family proline/betaine transporter-like MFS transporter